MESRDPSTASPSSNPRDVLPPWRRNLVTSSLALSAELAHSMQIPLPAYHRYQGNTNNCGPYTLSIVGNALVDEERFDPDIVAEEMNRVSLVARPFPHPFVSRIRNWATFPWGITRYLQEHGFQSRWRTRGTLERLFANLHQQIATIVMIGEILKSDDRWFAGWGWGHVKALYGYASQAGFAFVDPGCPKDPSDAWGSQGIFWQDQISFYREWSNLLRIYIEVSL